MADMMPYQTAVFLALVAITAPAVKLQPSSSTVPNAATVAASLKCSSDSSRRPLIHFTAEKNWINDPNGLVHWKGEYHLFFQHNPHGVEWGSMTWGHAVSQDLLHWQQLEHAILPDDFGDIWSGSAVVDLHNVSGLQFSGDEEPPMLAFYTGMGGFGSEQRLAVSRDRGRHFVKMHKSVVPNLQQVGEDNRRNARDPKVEWHARSKRWIMVLFHGYKSTIGPSFISPYPQDYNHGVGVFGIYTSKDLLSWEMTQEIEINGDSECPDLFELPVTKASGENAPVVEHKFVFLTAGGSYLVGEFDGKRFTATQPSQQMEFGDGYAPQTFHNMPQGRRVQIAWLGNNGARTCKRSVAFSDEPYTGQMSIPMELDLVQVSDGGLRIRRQPARELLALRQKPLLTVEDAEMDLQKPIEVLADDAGRPLEVLLKLRVNGSSILNLQLAGHLLKLEVEPKASIKTFVSGIALHREDEVSCSAVLTSDHGLQLPLETDAQGTVMLRAVGDRHSLELFDSIGGASMALCSPSLCQSEGDLLTRRVVRLAGQGGKARVEEFTVWPLDK